jgi:DNA-binding winged helix-turn-helix (wHTH) protein
LRKVTMNERPICQFSVKKDRLRFHIARLRRTHDGREGERYVTNVPGRGYCVVAAVSRAASPYIQHLYG